MSTTPSPLPPRNFTLNQGWLDRMQAEGLQPSAWTCSHRCQFYMAVCSSLSDYGFHLCRLQALRLAFLVWHRLRGCHSKSLRRSSLHQAHWGPSAALQGTAARCQAGVPGPAYPDPGRGRPAGKQPFHVVLLLELFCVASDDVHQAKDPVGESQTNAEALVPKHHAFMHRQMHRAAYGRSMEHITPPGALRCLPLQRGNLCRSRLTQLVTLCSVSLVA